MTSFHIAANERRKIIKHERSSFFDNNDHSDASESCKQNWIRLPTWPNPMNHFEKRKTIQRTELKHANNLKKKKRNSELTSGVRMKLLLLCLKKNATKLLFFPFTRSDPKEELSPRQSIILGQVSVSRNVRIRQSWNNLSQLKRNQKRKCQFLPSYTLYL